MRSWNPDLLRKPWDMVASEHRWLQITMNVYRSSPMHLFDVQAFWLMTWWCQAIFGMSWADWWTDSCVGADTGSRRENHKEYAFLAHVHCRVQLRYLSELVGCDMLWSPTITLTVKEKQSMGSHNCPSSRNRTPLSRRRSQNMCFGYVRLIFSDQTQDCTKKSSVLLRLI